MKKIYKVVFVLFFIGVLLATNSLSSVTARPTISSIAPGSWSTGTEFTIDLEKYPAPYDYLQLFGKGVKLATYGEICHPFTGGQHNWVADIRRLVNDKWVKVPTEQGWLNGVEALYEACAQAPAAGTYALFAYYNGPRESAAASSCAAGLTLITTSPADYENVAREATWNGETWATEDSANWNTSLCNLPVVNFSPSTIVVTVRTATNSCNNHTINPGQTAWISSPVVGGTCPLELYEGPAD